MVQKHGYSIRQQKETFEVEFYTVKFGIKLTT